MRQFLTAILISISSSTIAQSSQHNGFGIGFQVRCLPLSHGLYLPTYLSLNYAIPRHYLGVAYGTVLYKRFDYRQNSVACQYRFFPFKEKQNRFYLNLCFEINRADFTDGKERIEFEQGQFQVTEYDVYTYQNYYMAGYIGFGMSLELSRNLYFDWNVFAGGGEMDFEKVYDKSTLSSSNEYGYISNSYWSGGYWDPGCAFGLTYQFTKNKTHEK